jgi:hypothetical protein
MTAWRNWSETPRPLPRLRGALPMNNPAAAVEEITAAFKAGRGGVSDLFQRERAPADDPISCRFRKGRRTQRASVAAPEPLSRFPTT